MTKAPACVAALCGSKSVIQVMRWLGDTALMSTHRMSSMSTSRLSEFFIAGRGSRRPTGLICLTTVELVRTAKRLCIVPLLFLSFGVHASEWCEEPELNISGLSKHFYETQYSAKHGWNNLNIGVGLTCHLSGVGRWNDEAEVGVFRNSYRNTSFYAAYGIYYPVTPLLSVGLRNIIASGYRTHEHSSDFRVGPLPTLKVKLNDSVTLKLSIAPISNAFICANLGINF